jgi:hypothetical protein
MFGGEAANCAASVLVDALEEVRGYADIDRAVETACHDVDGGVPFHAPVIAAEAWKKKVDARSSPA